MTFCEEHIPYHLCCSHPALSNSNTDCFGLVRMGSVWIRICNKQMLNKLLGWWLYDVSAFLLWLSHVYPPHLPSPHIMVQYSAWIRSSVLISYESTIPFPPFAFLTLSIHAIPFSSTKCAARCIRGAFAVHFRCIRSAFAVHLRCICCAFVLQLRSFALWQLLQSCSMIQCGAFVAEFFINTRKTEQKTRNQATQKKIRTLPPSTDYQNIKTSTQNIVKPGTTRQHPPSSESNEKRNGWPSYHGMRAASNPMQLHSNSTRGDGTGCRLHTGDVAKKGHEVRNWRLHNIEDKSRTDRKGGGAIFIEENISYGRTLKIPHEIEGVSIKIRTIEQVINITTFYLPPAEYIDFGIVKPILSSCLQKSHYMRWQECREHSLSVKLPRTTIEANNWVKRLMNSTSQCWTPEEAHASTRTAHNCTSILMSPSPAPTSR